MRLFLFILVFMMSFSPGVLWADHQEHSHQAEKAGVQVHGSCPGYSPDLFSCTGLPAETPSAIRPAPSSQKQPLLWTQERIAPGRVVERPACLGPRCAAQTCRTVDRPVVTDGSPGSGDAEPVAFRQACG